MKYTREEAETVLCKIAYPCARARLPSFHPTCCLDDAMKAAENAAIQVEMRSVYGLVSVCVIDVRDKVAVASVHWTPACRQPHAFALSLAILRLVTGEDVEIVDHMETKE